jgi:hypothetical protein
MQLRPESATAHAHNSSQALTAVRAYCPYRLVPPCASAQG